MEIAEQLQSELSKLNTRYIADYIIANPIYIEKLMDLIFQDHPLYPMRASWVATTISETHPEILNPYIPEIISNLRSFKHSGVRRNLLRYLSMIEIPELYLGQIYDDCYFWLLSKNEPPAVKVHSMQIIYNIAKAEPDLMREFKLLLEELSDHESAAIKSRSREIIKKIQN